MLWGNKFTTSYYFLFLLSILYCISEYSKRERDIIWWVKYIIYAVFTMLFEIWIGCTTVFVATILFFILIICKNKIKNIICKRSFVIISMIASGIVVNVMEYILLNEYVQNIIVGLLGENLSLTGRTVVYSRYLYPLIYDSIWFGHGFSNTMLYQKTNVFFNVQNGFFDVIVNYGLLGLLFLLATVWMCVGKEISRKYGWGLYVLIYSLILASIIEVSYNFIFLLALYILINIEKVSSPCAKEECVKRNYLQS